MTNSLTMEELLAEITGLPGGKILFVVLDGLGGLPVPELEGRTELEAAHTPNMDALAAKSSLGMSNPVLPGVTSGSNSGHLALFGYDPLQYIVGRGVLEALGVGFDLQAEDVACRANFATAKRENGKTIITDRRAGRPTMAEAERLAQKLSGAVGEIDGIEVFIEPVREHRFVAVFRGEGLSVVDDTDPQRVGAEPLFFTGQLELPMADRNDAQRMATTVATFIERATAVLDGEPAANFVLLRGFSKLPNWPSFEERYGLNAAAVTVYPMYRGLALLVGMMLEEFKGETINDEITALERIWDDFDFFFLHFKAPDLHGEDGDCAGKVRAIEEFDKAFPRLINLKPDVLVVTGDHSTPSVLKSHSWHPVPFMLHGKHVIPMPDATNFDERRCFRGSLGSFEAKHAMLLMLANAGRLGKFSA